MALGVLEDQVLLEHVPGTVYVLDRESRTGAITERDTHSKRDTSGRWILVPQPSDSPDDPLNWPLWRRDLILGIICFVAILAETTSILLAVDSVTLAIDFERTFTEAALLTGYQLCGVGVGGCVFVASAKKYGKRHLLLLGCILLIASCGWGGATHHSKSYKSMIWARVVQGVATAPFEALITTICGDLYCTHERGTRVAVVNVAIFGSIFLAPVIVGHIAATMGWQWSFYFIAILGAASFPLLLFICPETAYSRAAYLNTDIELETFHPKSQEHLTSAGDHPPLYEQERTAHDFDQPGRTPYIRTLSPFNGPKTKDPFLKILIRPFPLFIHPAIVWACLIQGVVIGFSVFVGVVLAAVYLGPPLFFTEVETGNLYVAPFIGSVVGFILSGLLSDWTNGVMIRWNHGKYEPEFRILLVLPMLVFCAIGLYGFGITAADPERYGWLIPDVFLAFLLVGLVMGAVASALYIVDAHRDIAVEAFTCLLIFKNMFSFVLTYFAFEWVFSVGIRKLFIIIASLQVAICLLSIPMYMFGKRNRSFFYRHDLLRFLR